MSASDLPNGNVSYTGMKRLDEETASRQARAMCPSRLRWAPIAVVLGFTAAGLLLMALYRPLPLGIGVFIFGLALLYPATRSTRRLRDVPGLPKSE